MKIQNTTQSSKRIRLIALDGAVANIDDSVKADLAILPLFNGRVFSLSGYPLGR